MKKHFVFGVFGILLIVLSVGAVSAAMYTQGSLNSTANPSQDYTNPSLEGRAQFVFKEMKYEPYPVNAGDWFDVWIKVQNVGVVDAPNSTFVLAPAYPFSAPEDTLVQSYGLVPGTMNAANYLKEGETVGQESQIVLKYRVQVVGNADSGTYNLTLYAYPYGVNGTNGVFQTLSFSLPITVAKTKTDFEVVMQDVSQQGVSFSIANTGENPATAVVVGVQPDPSIFVRGPQSTILGNLDTGDFTTVTFQIAPRVGPGSQMGQSGGQAAQATRPSIANSILLNISYTDTAGIRNTIQKNVTVDLSSLAFNATGGRTGRFGASATTTDYTPWIYGFVGLALGALIATYVVLSRRRKHEAH